MWNEIQCEKILHPPMSSQNQTNGIQSTCRSRLEYSSTIWDPFLKTEKGELEKIHRRGARFVFIDYSRTSRVTDILYKLDRVPLSERRRDAAVDHGLIAIPSWEYLIKSSNRTRSFASNSYRHYTTNTSAYANCFSQHTIKD